MLMSHTQLHSAPLSLDASTHSILTGVRDCSAEVPTKGVAVAVPDVLCEHIWVLHNGVLCSFEVVDHLLIKLMVSLLNQKCEWFGLMAHGQYLRAHKLFVNWPIVFYDKRLSTF